MLICILTKNVITSCSVTMMLFLHLEVIPLMTLTTVLFFFSSRRRHTRCSRDWSSDVCSSDLSRRSAPRNRRRTGSYRSDRPAGGGPEAAPRPPRSEEHTSELQSRLHLVCRLLLEKKNKTDRTRLHNLEVTAIVDRRFLASTRS